MTREKYTNFKSLYNEYRPLYDELCVELRKILAKMDTSKISNLWPQNVIDDVVLNNDTLEVTWGIFEPAEHIDYIPVEWLFDDTWYEKYISGLEEQRLKEQEIQNLKEQARQNFFSQK